MSANLNPLKSCHCGDPATLTTTSQRQMCSPCAYAVHETCICSTQGNEGDGAYQG